MARPGTTEPDLVGELRSMKTRLEALERKPIPQSTFDQYPAVEWAATGRPRVSGNVWTSCSMANVSGLKYDRVELKYITDRILKGRSEAEIRVAAFRHSSTSQFKECVSASSVIRLVGGTTRAVGVGKWRWMHGIQFGWDYTEADDAIYTIELQHRNPDNMPQKVDPTTQVFGPYKDSDKAAPSGFDQIFFNDGEGAGQWIWGNMLRYTSSNTWVDDGTPANYGWNNLAGAWDGAYNISNMHYCVGLPQERLPSATPAGWHWYVGGESNLVRAGNIAEPFMSV